VDAEFSAKARIQMMTDGSTATVAIIHDGKVYVGNGICAFVYVVFVSVYFVSSISLVFFFKF